MNANSERPENTNPYAAQMQAAPTQSELDAAAPQLKSNDIRGANRSAMIMLAILAAVVVAGAAWVIAGPSSRNDTRPKPQKEETVNIPEAPKAPALPPTPQAPPASQPQQAQAIPVMPMVPRSAPQPLSPPPPRAPTLVERRIASANGESAISPSAANSGPAGYGTGGSQAGPGMPGMAGMQGTPGVPENNPFFMPSNAAYKGAALPDVSSAQPLTHPDNLMLRGTYIRCVLETRIITDIPGFTSCIVNEPIYSFTGKQLLLPKGSKVLGKYEQEPNSDRVAVIWDRVVTPTGIDVSMASPGVDNLGGAGHPGNYNAHWASRISSALLISMLSDAFKYEAAKKGPTTSTIGADGTIVQQPFQSNTAQTVQNLADQAVRAAANRPATVTINQGTVVTIYVAKDVDFTGVLARY